MLSIIYYHLVAKFRETNFPRGRGVDNFWWSLKYGKYGNFNENIKNLEINDKKVIDILEVNFIKKESFEKNLYVLMTDEIEN